MRTLSKFLRLQPSGRPSARFVLTLFLILLAAPMLTACTSTVEKASCAQRDWYEVGRRDGSQGATLDRRDQYRAECSEDFGDHLETIYTNGRNAGLVEFCQTDNAFQLGRMGIAYMYVCPSTMEPQFLTGYRRGQQARLLEVKKKDLDAQIDELSKRLEETSVASEDYENREIHSELDELRKLRAANDSELSKISR